MRTRVRSSILVMALRFSLSKKAATWKGTRARTSAVRSFSASSSIKRKIARDRDSTSRIMPWPLQRGQTTPLLSPNDGRRRWRDISSKPKREIRPTCTRARSASRHSRIRSSTARWFFAGVMSIKSITIKPPMSRKRSWRAISSAASRLVCRAVSSMSLPLVARAELISMDTRASVGSMTNAPPEGSFTSRWKAVSIWLSIWKRLNNGTLSWYSLILLAYCGIT